MVVPLILEKQNAGEILLYPNESTFSVQADPFIEHLRAWVDSPVIEKLIAEKKDDAIRAEAIDRAGMKAKFDERTLELHVSIPAILRRTNTVFVNQLAVPPDLANAVRPNAFSSFVNVRAGQDFSGGRQPLRTDFDGAVQVKSFVLEGSATYSERSSANPLLNTGGANSPTAWTRGDIRVVKDFPDAMVRVAAGDLSYPVSYFQRYRPLGGITVASQFSLQPYRVTMPLGSEEIFLKSPSRVVIWANGVRIQTLYLPSGRHDLKNVVVGNGVNEVRLDITDDVGRTETVVFPWISDAEMLNPGLHQLAYSAGFPWTPSINGTRLYDSAKPTYSVSHRLGLTNNLTGGFNAQGDRLQRVLGTELLATSRLGTSGLEPSMSFITGYDHATAVRVRHSFTDFHGMKQSQRNLSLSAEFKERSFGALDDLAPNVASSVDLQASYGQVILGSLSTRLSVGYQINRKIRDDVVNGHSESISLVKGWFDGLQTTLTFSHRRSQLGVRETGAFLFLSWAIPGSNHFLSASEDTIRKAQRIDWRYNAPQLTGGYNAGAAFERSPEQSRADGELGYLGNRGTLAATHTYYANRASSPNHQNVTGLRVGTAIAFAGGHFAVGRPITDSFAIVASANALKGQTVDVNPTGSSYYDARIDCLGPALVPNVRPYQYYPLYFDPSSVEAGFDIGAENYVLRPTYKSGTAIAIGTEAQVLLGGVLKNSRGEPISLESGEAHRSDPQSNDSPALFVFTNKKGKFRSEGFRAGTYVLTLFSEKWNPITITIPENSRGLYDVGELRVEPKN